MNKPRKSFWLTSRGIVAFCAILFITYFLLVEHRQHLVEWLPYAILLLCPLMHIFMHGGHGHHHSENPDQKSSSDLFKETTEQSEAYRDGFIEGLKEARKERSHKESDDAQ